MLRRSLSFVFVFSLIVSLFQPVSTYASNKVDNLISTAKKYSGVPYLYGGTTPSGFDCSGYVRYVFNEVDISLPRTTTEQYNTGAAVNRSNLEKGDLVFFKTTSKNGPSHAGIYIGSNQFIHASTSKGVMISSVNDPYYWGSRYLGARRVLKEEEVKPATLSLPTLPQGQYHDVASSIGAYKPITQLGTNGAFNGVADQYFKPNDMINRGEVAVILANVLSLDTSDKQTGFKDIPANHPQAGAIAALSKAGIIKGDLEGNFRPNDPITRGHIAIILAKAFDITKNGEGKNFVDVGTSHPAYEYIEMVSSNGIIKGYDDNTFRPQNNTTRAQFAILVHNALN